MKFVTTFLLVFSFTSSFIAVDAAPKTGNNSLLAVRVTSSTYNEQPQTDIDKIKGRVFGVGPKKETHTVMTQFEACSFGKQNLYPATGDNIDDGIVEVDVNFKIAGCDIIKDCRYTIKTATEEKLGTSLDDFDFVMMCVPNGSKWDGGSWGGFANTGGNIAWFEQGHCDEMAWNMHELGHSMGLSHSGEGSDSYGDFTGSMGSSPDDVARFCFNGQKYHLLGWMDDKRMSSVFRVVSATMDVSMLSLTMTAATTKL